MLFVFMLACGTPGTPALQGGEPSAGAEPGTAAPPAAPVAEQRPAEAPSPEITPEPTPAPPPPWVMKEPGPMVDEFTFLGWSSDGRRYAFQNAIAAQGASCSQRYEVFVVDAATDSYPEGGTLEVKHESPEGGRTGCMPPDLAPLLEEGRGRLLEAHGIVMGSHTEPQRVSRLDSGMFGAHWGDSVLPFTFIERYAVSGDPYGDEAKAGSSYVLTLHPPGGEPRLIEAGKRRRSYVVGYSVLGAPLFVNPAGTYGALIVRKVHAAFEGTRTSYMSNGFALQAKP